MGRIPGDDSLSERLLDVKKKIERTRTERDQLLGKKESAQHQLTARFGVPDLSSAQERLKEIQAKIQEETIQLQKEIQELERVVQ
jgi:predicted nuclease with TOPRIM domain